MPEYLKPPKRLPKPKAKIPPKSQKRLEKEAAEKEAGTFKPKQQKPIRKVSAKRQEQIEKGLVKLTVGKPLKRISPKQAAIEKAKSKVYRLRSEGERPYCQGCGRFDVPLSNSHRIGQTDKEHVANAANLDTYCIDGKNCHNLYESGRLYLLDNGNDVLDWLAETDWERYRAKVWKMLDRINDDNLSLTDLPEWVESHVLAVTK